MKLAIAGRVFCVVYDDLLFTFQHSTVLFFDTVARWKV
jgi:hypothetical protein